MKKILQSTLAAALLIAFTSCSSDDSNDIVEAIPVAESGISANINGSTWVGTPTSIKLLRSSQANEQRFDIIAENGANRISVSCSSELTTQEGMPLGTYTFTRGAAGGDALFTFYYLSGGNAFMEHFPSEGTLTITAVDVVNKKISGTFNFSGEKVGTLQQTIVTPETINVTSGVFTDLPYTVFNI